MGFFDFVKSAGEKLTGKAPEDKAGELAWRQAALENVPAKHGLAVTGFAVTLADDVATIRGEVASQEIREKIVLAIGNTAGIARVDDQLTVSAVAAPATAAASPSGAAAVASAEPTSIFYVVKSGDNLSKIAKQHYGDANTYRWIFEANKPMLSHPDKIYPGQVLRIPPKSV